jgi:hypothetical protein
MMASLPPAIHLPNMDATLSTTLWNVQGSALSKHRKHPTRTSAHPLRNVSKEADAISDEEKEFENKVLSSTLASC